MNDNNYFKITFKNEDLEFEVESAELELVSANVHEERTGLYINIQGKGRSFERQDEDGSYEHYVKPRIYTEWLDLPTDGIKNRDYRTLEAMKVDFKDSGRDDGDRADDMDRSTGSFICR